MRDCKTCTRPQPASCASCPLANGLQPEVPPWLMLDMQLHKDMKRWGKLPDAGGLLDQDQRTMARVNFIEDVYQEREQKRMKEEQRKQEREQKRQQMRSQMRSR